MYINDFLKNYRGNKYLKAGFKNWCNSHGVLLKQSENDWINIFECDYAEMREREAIKVKKSAVIENNPAKEEIKFSEKKVKRGNK